jgi:hypothetical protein
MFLSPRSVVMIERDVCLCNGWNNLRGASALISAAGGSS